MEYKPVWPASGRDFCSTILIRELAEGVFGLASEAVGNTFENSYFILSPSLLLLCELHSVCERPQYF